MSPVVSHPLGPVSIPAQPKDSAQRGPLQQYTTFRYHAGGVPEFQLNETRANIFGTPIENDVRFRVGLRGANGQQATTTLVWARGERGTRKKWANTLSGQYALNCRLDFSASGWNAKQHGSFLWKGQVFLAYR